MGGSCPEGVDKLNKPCILFIRRHLLIFRVRSVGAQFVSFSGVSQQ